MKYRFLSYPVSEKIPTYGTTPKPVAKKINDMETGAHCNTGEFTMSNHAGTHVDGPRHFNASGRAITEYSADELVFVRPYVLDVSMEPGGLIPSTDFENSRDEILGCDILIIRTGFSLKRDEPVYYEMNPGISPEAATYLRNNFPELKGIGIDSISVSSFAHREEGRVTHQIFFDTEKYSSKPLLLIEDMDLSGDFSGLKKIIVAPIMLQGLDSAPCIVIAEFS